MAVVSASSRQEQDAKGIIAGVQQNDGFRRGPPSVVEGDGGS
jgi:hypothetical protein